MRRLLPLLLVAIAPVSARAQDPLVRAEQLMRSGRVFAAESVYYWAVTSKPRDPAARMALGRHLAARGAWKTAATLLEEARFFGGDARLVATHLVPVYERLGAYRNLTELPASPLSEGERLRAIHLRDHRMTRRGADSVVLPLRRTPPEPVGAIVLRIGRDSVVAHIDPTVRGVVLDSAWQHRREVRRFAGASDAATAVGVVPQLMLGTLVLGNVPVSFAARGQMDRALVGLDFLAAFAPTIDERAGTITLRAAGKLPSLRGRRIATLAWPGSYLILEREGRQPLSLASGEARAVLEGRRWSVGIGELVIEQ